MSLNAEAVNRFFYWINERHRIYLKKEAGEPWPWTEDPILQKYKFTNPFRENDRDTKWMRVNWDNPYLPPGDQLFNTAFFRLFGGIPFLDTHRRMYGLVTDGWDTERTKQLARRMIENKEKVFTGAYIVTNQGLKLPKEEVVVDYFLKPIYEDRHVLAARAQETKSLELYHRGLGAYPGFGGGGFMAYEVVTDSNHQWLKDAADRYTWANAGPGAKRGLNRLHDRPLEDTRKRDWNAEMQQLLSLAVLNLGEHIIGDPVTQPMVDMRMIEHSLCEWDKYERVRLGQGTPRSLYRRK